MKNVFIASATVFALVASAGMTTAGPLRNLGQNGFSKDARLSVSQPRDYADSKANKQQSTNLTSSGSTAGSQLPNVVVIPVQDGDDFTVIFGKESGSDLSDQPVYWRYW